MRYERPGSIIGCVTGVTVNTLFALVDEVSFHRSTLFRFEPRELAISYDPARIGTDRGRFQLLHEIGHILLGHEYGLRGEARWRMERDAWDVAHVLARQFQVRIQPAHAEAQLSELRRKLADSQWNGLG